MRQDTSRDQLLSEIEQLKGELEKYKILDSHHELEKAKYQHQLMAMDASQDGIAILDENEKYIYLNKAHALVYGYDNADDLLGKPWRILYYPQEIEKFEKIYMPILMKKGHWFGISIGKRRDGSRFDQEVSLTVIKRGGLICVVRDITERRQIEESLVESEDKYRTLIENIQDGLFLIRDRKIIFANEAAARMIGYQAGDLLGMSFEDLIFPEDLRFVLNRYENRIQGHNVPNEYEFRLKYKDSDKIVYVNMNVGLINYRGTLVSLGTIKDITDRRQKEQIEQRRIDRIIRQQHAIVGLAKENFSDLDNALGKIAEVAATTLEIERVSIWKFNDDHTALKCLKITSRSHGELAPSEPMPVAHYPNYFSKLEVSRTIAANDAIADPATSEFGASYLSALGISSLLDAPIRIHGRTIGVVCHEHVGPKRQWTSEEQDFAGSIADMVSLILETWERKRTENEREALYKIGEAVSTTENLDALLVTIYRNIEKVMYAKNCYIALYNPQSEIVSFPLFIDIYDPTPAPRRKKRGLTEYVLRIGKSVLLTPTIFNELMDQGEVERIGTLPESWLGVPLYVRYKVMGVLVVQSYDSSQTYTERDKELLLAIGNQAAVAIDRKLGEEALRESEERFRALFETARDIIFIKNQQLQYVSINPATASFFKMDPVSSVGSTDREIFGDEVARFSETIERRVLDGDIVEIEQAGPINGSEKIFHVIRAPMRNSHGDIIGLFGIARDITELKLSRTILAEEKERLAVTLRSIADGVITTDVHGRVLLINKVAEGLTGWSQKEAEGKKISAVFHFVDRRNKPPRKLPVDRVLQTGRVFSIENNTTLVARDGSEKMIAQSWAPIKDEQNKVVGAVLVFRDITERRKIELELQKANKLESVGMLAGGIAHDFNNILTAILGNVTLAKLDVPERSEIFEILSEVEKASMRAKDLTQQLLTFSIGGAPIRKTATINELIKESTAFALRGSNVRFEFNIPDDLWTVEVDIGQMNQVIQNLVINADQAMPEGGLIKIHCRNVKLPSDETINGQSRARGNFVKISIQDQGHGIPSEHLARVFDPYFTTKQKGSGLGLATVYSIIRKHEGYIAVESTLGKGATFHLYLPASEKKATPKISHEKLLVTGKGSVLVMDDEEIIRNSFARMIRMLGYQIRTVADGAEMIEEYRRAQKSGQRYDAVIMDLTVPGGMGGKEAIQHLKQIDPDVKGIVSSGYSNAPVLSSYEDYGFCGFLTKPFKIEELSAVLYKAMART
ncbi:MAG: PAS domain S-box protein [Candidatus Zhuqueibacterota bacterium]